MDRCGAGKGGQNAQSKLRFKGTLNSIKCLEMIKAGLLCSALKEPFLRCLNLNDSED